MAFSTLDIKLHLMGKSGTSWLRYIIGHSLIDSALIATKCQENYPPLTPNKYLNIAT